MKKWVSKFALFLMWLFGAISWHLMATGYEANTVVGDMFNSGSIVLGVIAAIVLVDTIRYFGYWVDSKIMGI